MPVFVCTILLTIAVDGRSDTNFSQYPGFAEYFAANPPSPHPAGPADRGLLERYRPRFLLPPGHAGPIDFYRDYVAQGELRDGRGGLISNQVTREELNRHVDEPEAEFRHRPGPGPVPEPVVYGRVDRREVGFDTPDGEIRRPFTFLTYHAVFRYSGLPAGLPGWKAFVLGLAGDLADWHQLDHYTAATLILDHGRTPVAVMLQQHNYLHTYLIGEGIELAPDGRVLIDVAVRSNELYPHVTERRRRRAVRYASPKGVAYLMGFGAQPFVAADDITEGKTTVDYRLEYLPPDDAFYMFAGFLGERRLLPGRSGPPGASYNTRPQLKPLEKQMLSGYWREQNAGDWQRYRDATDAGRGLAGFAVRQSTVFYANWQCLQRKRENCVLE